MKLHDNLNKRIGGVYRITNISNGKYYIGSSMYIQDRWGAHIRDLNSGVHDNLYLQRAWNKFGQNKFLFEVLECILVRDKKLLLEREQYYIDKVFNETEIPSRIIYNLCHIASSKLGVQYPESGKIKKGKCVYQINPITLDIINTFETLQRAAEAISVNRTSISACCRGQVPQIKGFIWRFIDQNLETLEPWVQYQNIKRRKVKQIDPISLVVIKIWTSVREAANTLSIDENNISRNAKLNRKWKCGGYYWEYSYL